MLPSFDIRTAESHHRRFGVWRCPETCEIRRPAARETKADEVSKRCNCGGGSGVKSRKV
jgi:hypothetical protein